MGAYRETWQVGLHFKIPLIDRIARKVSLKEQVIDFPPQPVITKDVCFFVLRKDAFSPIKEKCCQQNRHYYFLKKIFPYFFACHSISSFSFGNCFLSLNILSFPFLWLVIAYHEIYSPSTRKIIQWFLYAPCLYFLFVKSYQHSV